MFLLSISGLLREEGEPLADEVDGALPRTFWFKAKPAKKQNMLLYPGYTHTHTHTHTKVQDNSRPLKTKLAGI